MFRVVRQVRILLRRCTDRVVRAADPRTMNKSLKRSCEPAIRTVPVRRLIIAIAVAAAAATASARAGEALSAKTWLGHAAEIEHHLVSAEIVRIEAIGTGVTKPQRAHLAPPAP